jgi:hypothetical protein
MPETQSDITGFSEQCEAHQTGIQDLRAFATTHLAPLREREEAYRAAYPYENKDRLFDSEVSICLLLQDNLSAIGAEVIGCHLHIDSDRPPCFYCVQALNYFAKLWARLTGKSWLICVSSHEDYPWKGRLPPGHDIPANDEGKRTMRNYGRDRDDCYDAPLTEEELVTFTYSTESPGKIIQMFFSAPEASGAAAAAAGGGGGGSGGGGAGGY